MKAEGLPRLECRAGESGGAASLLSMLSIAEAQEPTGPDGEKPQFPPSAMALCASSLEWMLAESWL